MVRLALVSRPAEESEMRLAEQMGVTDIVSILPGRSTTPQQKQDPVWEYFPFVHLRKQVEDAGLTLSVIESIAISNRITLGYPVETKTWTSFANP